MTDDGIGRPIPKIVGRGKNRLKRPHTAHSYDLRSSITRCHSSEDATCSFCHFYRTSHDDLLEYNGKLRTQLLKATTRTLIVDRWSRQKDGKIRKLRGILQERADALQDKSSELQQHLREARIRKEELQNTFTQLQQSREEVADLHSQLEHAGKKIKTLEEVCQKDKLDMKRIKDSLESLIQRLSPFLLELKDNSGGNSADTQSISSKLDNLQEAMALCEVELSNRSEGVDVMERGISQGLIERMITEVKCGVCHDLFIDPVALPCGHVFCEFCIRMWFKRIRGCPVCRRKVITCSQLHAVYQFREIVGILNEYRCTEEQETRTQEIAKRTALHDDLYSDPVPRRMRERPSSSTDRGERFTSRRRRLENGTASVPYPIPLPDSGLPTARLDVAPRSQGVLSPPAMMPHQVPNPFSHLAGEAEGVTTTGQESSRNMMSLLLNETFSSIDRFLRGAPTGRPFPTIRPMNMIEFPTVGQPDTEPAEQYINVIPNLPTSSEWEDQVTVSGQEGEIDVGTSENPIIVPDYASAEEIPRQTPPGSPPGTTTSSGSSEEIWPNQPSSQHTSTQILSHEESVQVSLQSEDSEYTAPESFTEDATVSAVGELEHLLDGEFLSTSSDSDETFSETESESETETETETASEAASQAPPLIEDVLEEVD